MKLIKKIPAVIVNLIFLIFSIALISLIAYLLGNPILNGESREAVNLLIGNDSGFALSLVYWFERFFPKMPIWYPLQGMGVSLLYSYPMGTTFLILLLSRLTGFSLVEWFRLMAFATFPLTALGIYFFAWIRFKKQLIGLVAAVFFLLSQASWLMQSLHGVFAQSFSLIMVAPTWLFFDLFLERWLKGKKQGFETRLFLVLTAFLMAATFLLHVVTGAMLALTIAVWAGWRVGLKAKFKPVRFFKHSFKGVLLAFIPVLLGAGLAAFWLMPFSTYSRLANRDGLNTRSIAQIQEESLKIPSLLGLGVLGQGQYRYDFFFFATPVLIFLGLGGLMVLVRRDKKALGLLITVLVSFFLVSVPIYLPFIASLFQFFFTTVYFRGLIPALIALPVLAAWGVWALPDFILIKPLNWLEKKKGRKNKLVYFSLKVARFFFNFLILVLVLLVVTRSIDYFQHQSPTCSKFRGAYRHQFEAYGPSLSDHFWRFLKSPFEVENWRPEPDEHLSKMGLESKLFINRALDERLKIDNKTILDVSPYAAGGAIMQGVGLTSDARFVNLYHYYASLIHGMWGYQAGVFYGQELLYQSPKLHADLSDWFGIKYAIIVPGFDPIKEKYQANGWRPLEDFNQYAVSEKPEFNQGSWRIEAWEYPKSTGLYTLGQQPAVLVITDYKKGGYDQIFRAANLGALPYQQAWLVEGDSKKIDAYSLSELSEFEGLILHGYDYTSRSQTWGKINQFLSQGGKVFVDTGWQYVSKDWGSKNGPVLMPEPLPIAKTNWENIGTSWDGVSVSPEIKKINFDKFDPPVWDNNPWGMALAQKEDLREGAEPLLWKGDQVLMARRRVGKGEIIWSGINVFAHVNETLNEAEGEFLGQVLKPLFADKKENLGEAEIGYLRSDPDLAEFNFSKPTNQPAWFLFREALHPYWKAVLVSDKREVGLPLYRGGPGLMMVKLPAVKNGDKLIFELKLNFKDGFLAKTISFLTLWGLLVYLIIGHKVKISQMPLVNNIQKKLRKQVKNLAEEEDY